MKWYYVFIKSLKEQIRDYWILLIVILLSPFFIFIYYLMIEAEKQQYDILLVNRDRGIRVAEEHQINLGDSLIHFLRQESVDYPDLSLQYFTEENRETAMDKLQNKKADVLLVLPEDLTDKLHNSTWHEGEPAVFELAGNVTDMHYIIGAIWTEELFNRYLVEITGIELPVIWKETQIGYSGERTEFELYVPGMLILAIIMMMFSASAAIVREPEIQTLKRLKLSRIGAFEFLVGISLVQIIVAAISMVLAIITAVLLGYSIIPGTLWYIILIAFLTSLSVIAFSLIFAAFCHSIKDVAIVGTFPLLIFMFFTGAAFPVSGRTLFTIGEFKFSVAGILSPTHSVTALNKVLVMGQSYEKTFPEITALVILTVLYFILGVWFFNRRHMRMA